MHGSAGNESEERSTDRSASTQPAESDFYLVIASEKGSNPKCRSGSLRRVRSSQWRL